MSTAWAFEPTASLPTSAVFRAGLAAFTKIFADTYAPPVERADAALWDEREDAATIAFLASGGAAYITGQNIRVDGGITRSV
jgi:NAD(P)-dependent dehydrogenase (short-subunit alcohol dehydrogenase family)